MGKLKISNRNIYMHLCTCIHANIQAKRYPEDKLYCTHCIWFLGTAILIKNPNSSPLSYFTSKFKFFNIIYIHYRNIIILSYLWFYV